MAPSSTGALRRAPRRLPRGPLRGPLAVALSLVLTSVAFVSPTAPARATVTISGLAAVDYPEQGAAVAIAPAVDLTVSSGTFADGYVEFSHDGTTNDALSLTTVESADTTSGAVSVVGSSVYLGLGGGESKQVGTVDSTKDGAAGEALRINFSAALENSDFSGGSVGSAPPGWTINNELVTLGNLATRTQGGTVTSTPRGTSPQTYTITGPSSSYSYVTDTSYTREGDEKSSSFTARSGSGTVISSYTSGTTRSNVLKLGFTGNCTGPSNVHPFCSVFGPEAISAPFDARQGDSLSFYVSANYVSDDFEVYAFLVEVDGDDTFTDSSTHTLLYYNRGIRLNWAEASGTIPKDGRFRFRFVNGTYDKSGYLGIGSEFYIDDVRVVSGDATADVAEQVARLVRFSSTEDDPTTSGLTRTLTLEAKQAGQSASTATNTLTFTPLTNDAPSLVGDGETTAVAVTVTETDLSSVENPLSDTTGTLTGNDPESDSITFGISGGTSADGVSTLAGSYGTLSVTEATGAYTYEPDMAAIKPLNTGDDPVDAFTITVSDGTDSSTGTLNFTIDSITDTEPSAPSIAAVIGGDGFLSVLVEPPSSIGGSAISNYEYSTDGGTFRALDPAVAAGPVQIATASADGTTALVNGTPFAVRVRAVNSGGSSPPSNSVSGTPTSTRAISSPTIQSFEPSAALTAIDEDFVISGFGPTDDLLVTVGLPGAGTGTAFALPDFEASGATVANGYSSYSDDTAVTDLGLTGTQSEVNAALRGLKLKTGADRENFQVRANVSVVSGDIVQSGTTGSFYEYVPDSGITWDEALAAAAGRTHAGVTGYLVTITSEAENAFVKDRIDGATNVWIAASDATEEGVWRWVAGPEGQNGGTVFYTEDDGTLTYASWSSNEPNDWGSGEDAAVTNWGSATGTWNDLLGTNSSSVNGYVVEYSEWEDQTFTSSAVLTAAPRVSMGGAVLTATGAATAVALSWTTPVRTGETVTGYTVTSVPSVTGVSACSGTATTCTVSGLTAGTEYTFTVTATWSDAATSVSNAASARALATPPPAPAPAPDPVITAPPLPSGPVLTAGAPPRPSNRPTARVGDVEVPVTSTPAGTTRQRGTTTVSTATIVQAGGVTFALDVTGAGEVRTVSGAAPQIEVVRDRTARTSGSGLLPATEVRAWLPQPDGTVRPVATLPVGDDGTFTGELPLDGSDDRPTDGRPLPIGTHVLQLVGVDTAGQLTVIEQTVRILQPDPAPEPDRRAGAPPALDPGSSIATNAGVPEAVTVVPVPDVRQARVEGSGWTMAVDIPSADGRVAPAEGGGALIELVEDDVAEVSGDGFLPGTRADVWLFSEPVLLGTVTIGADGTFAGTVPVEGIATGEHTLQLQGVGTDGYVRAANLGVVVVPRPEDEPAVEAEPEPAPEPEAEPDPEPDDRVEVVAAAGEDSGGNTLLVWIALLTAAAGSGWWFLLGRRRRDEDDAAGSPVRG